MDFGLSGKTAFVAGASSGIGFAIASDLADEGCNVALCSRDRLRIDAAASRLTGLDESVLPLVCDVRDEIHIKTAFETTVARFGGINILVTNAGGPPSGLIDDFDADDWRAAVELNLISTINLCRHAVPYLKNAAAETGHARIIMVTSVAAKQPIPNLYLSNAARAGVQGFAKSLAEELGVHGITVNTVLPGYTKTERLGELRQKTEEKTGMSSEAVEADWAAQNAVKRLGEPHEIAASVVFLASSQAAYITGIGLPVDGGRTKSLF